MGTQLLDIQPHELRFIVEVKKQSSCTIQLSNKSDHWVAFKVKTTSPKKYCVRPNAGVIKPSESCDFTVTMQVQRAAALEVQCKDKFLVQGTAVPSGTTEEGVTTDMFTKGSGRHIEERKMKVILIPAAQSPSQSSAQSPAPAPVNAVINQDASNDTSQKAKISNDTSEEEKISNDTPQKEKILSRVENLPSSGKITQESEGPKIAVPTEPLSVPSEAETKVTERTQELVTTKSTDNKESKTVEIKSPTSWMEEMKKQAEDLKSKIEYLGSKLADAEQNVARLTEERSKVMQEKEQRKRELVLMKRKVSARTVHVGFPLLYICMVALICLTVGYMMQPREVSF